MEYKAFLDFETKVNKRKGIVEGYASTYGNRDLQGERVLSSFFVDQLEALKAAGSFGRVKALWQHSTDMPVGKAAHLYTDTKGLGFEIKMLELAADVRPPIDPKYVMATIDQGVIDATSIGYDVTEYEEKFEESGERTVDLIKGVLHEISFVTFPANTQALITGSKAAAVGITRDGATGLWTETPPFNRGLVGIDHAADQLDGLKVGRTISKANRMRLLEARDAGKRIMVSVDAVLKSADATADNDKQRTPKRAATASKSKAGAKSVLDYLNRK